MHCDTDNGRLWCFSGDICARTDIIAADIIAAVVKCNVFGLLSVMQCHQKLERSIE